MSQTLFNHGLAICRVIVPPGTPKDMPLSEISKLPNLRCIPLFSDLSIDRTIPRPNASVAMEQLNRKDCEDLQVTVVADGYPVILFEENGTLDYATITIPGTGNNFEQVRALHSWITAGHVVAS